MDRIERMRSIAKKTGGTWHSQWDGRWVAVVPAKAGGLAEVEAGEVGKVTRYQCGDRDVVVLDPRESILGDYIDHTLDDLRLLAEIGPGAVSVRGPAHVLESASSRLGMRGIRTTLHGRELRIGRP